MQDKPASKENQSGEKQEASRAERRGGHALRKWGAGK